MTYFTIQFCWKNLTHFTKLNSLDIENNILPQNSQQPLWLYKFPANMFLFGVRKNIYTAPFSDAQELHSENTLKANVCIFLCISVRKLLFQRRHKILSGGVWIGGRLNNFLKAAHCLGLIKCLTIFHFNWNFWKFNFFQHFDTSFYRIKTLKFSGQFWLEG